MRSLFQAITDLHSAELYDDLKFYCELRLEEHLLDDELNENEQALLFKMIGDANFHTHCVFKCRKSYERALEIVKRLPRTAISKAELRFLLHKALLKENKFEDAIRVLSGIPKNEHTVKTRAALAKALSTRMTKQTRAEIVACHNFVLAHFPSTTPYTRTEILKLLKTDVIPKKTPSREEDHEATAAYFKSRHYLFNEQKPLRAIEALREYRKPNARIILELAILYNFVGNRSRAISELERLRLVDPYGIKGMDLLASLYYAFDKGTSKNSGKLEILVGYLTECHPNEPETFIALAYLSKKQNQLKDSNLFAQHALNLALPGKEKAHSAMLKAFFLVENKNFEAANRFLTNILLIDNQNIDAFELSVRSNLQRKAYDEAKRTAQICRNSIGTENPRANFIYAQAIYHQPSMLKECETILKTIADQFPYLTDGVVFLAQHLEREGKLGEAILMLQKAAECNSNPVIQDILVDIAAKCKKSPEKNMYFFRVHTNQPDSIESFILHSSLNSSSHTLTPICLSPGLGPSNIRDIHRAPRRQRNNAIRQSGVEMIRSLDFGDSDTSLEIMRSDLFGSGNPGFQPPPRSPIIQQTPDTS